LNLARLLDHIADHPDDRVLRLEAESVGTQMGDQAGIDQALIHRPVVDGDDADRTTHQLPGPAAGCRAEIDCTHAGLEPALAFIGSKQGEQGFFELEGRAAWRGGRKTQAWNAARPA